MYVPHEELALETSFLKEVSEETLSRGTHRV